MNGEVNSKEFNLGRMDVGTYHYLNRMLEEFDGYEDFLNSYAFGKRPVEKDPMLKPTEDEESARKKIETEEKESFYEIKGNLTPLIRILLLLQLHLIRSFH